MGTEVLELLGRLADPATRHAAAQELAAQRGAERLYLLVRDPELGTLLPALGHPRTLRGGPLWRQFLHRCREPGRHEGPVDLAGIEQAATAVAQDGLAMVLVGGGPQGDTAELEALLPVLAALLLAQQDADLARAEVRAARDMVLQSETLARSLEAARAETSRLIIELQREDQRKDEFLAMLGHELRNPLAPLTIALEVMRLRGADRELVDRQVDIMERQLTQLTRLVDDLLDVSRVVHGRIELQTEVLDLRQVLDHVIQAMQGLVEKHGHGLDYAKPSEPLWVSGDSARLQQVFSNLVHNAIKYTEDSGQISIRAARREDCARVVVADNGIGIDAQLLPRIFNVFEQGPAHLSRRSGGLGVGLTLVKRLVEQHGGAVYAHSAGAGQGSEFTVDLPLADGLATPA